MSLSTVIIIVLVLWAIFWLVKPKLAVNRPWRFLAGFIFTMVFGTSPLTDPEGRSVRLGVVAAIKYAWQLSA